MIKMFKMSELPKRDTEKQNEQILLLKKKNLTNRPSQLRVTTNLKFVKYEIYVPHIKTKYTCKCTGVSKLYQNSMLSQFHEVV